VTGCSSGIGRAAAQHLQRAGLMVYGTARRLDALAVLADEGIRVLELDVTDESSMTAAVEMIKNEHRQVDILVNNAGFELAGAVERIPAPQARQLFDTNFFGLARLTQLVLPGMREQRYGRIINVSSIYGRFAVPGEAYYAASKHAVAAFSEALRREVGGFGIRVALIEPTAARTRLDANTVWAGHDAEGPAEGGLDSVLRGRQWQDRQSMRTCPGRAVSSVA
jgi:NADP-dependent 3-hydroxy acid dehydrogenase YdfG